ncbi:MAG: GNAT family N-acetyltransferase [Sphingomonadales bacterium]|nr:GNAT family N-acetyltransferase [Sphingomonadales bacterium]
MGLLAVLEADELRLEPLEEHHRDALREACGEDEQAWAMFGISYDREHFDEAFSRLLANPVRLPFAILVGGEMAGLTSWIGADANWRSAEIGNTYLRPRFRGGQVNLPLKRLMLMHGFACGLKRMFFSIDVRNERSQAAVRKIGATFEGVLRNHMITWTGHERDSAIWSIVERDRERLGL